MAVAARNKGLLRVVSHWSAGHYEQFFEDYDIQLTGAAEIFVPNRILEDVEAHTWRRNSTSIGAAVLGVYRGNTSNLGPEPPTEEQIATLPKIIAVICKGLNWPIDKEHAPTHEEMATTDGYGPGSGDPQTRWDLWFLRDGEAPGTGGDQLRMLAQAYLDAEGAQYPEMEDAA
jgi:hypothetical protein